MVLHFRSFQSMSSDRDSEDDALEVTDNIETENMEMMLAERGRQVKTKDEGAAEVVSRCIVNK